MKSEELMAPVKSTKNDKLRERLKLLEEDIQDFLDEKKLLNEMNLNTSTHSKSSNAISLLEKEILGKS
jgi:hypothetical protein